MTATEHSLRDWFSNPELGLVRSVRPAQLEMAEAVADTFANGGFAFIEAGTGTGKSLAYAVPAALSEGRIVIATAKKALQEQLIGQDLPRIHRLVNDKPFAILKGKNNYACRLRWAEYIVSGAGLATVPRDDRESFEAWLAESETGDLSTYRDTPWLYQARVSECVRKHCEYKGTCGYVRSREKGKVAEILVVNHALLAADLAVGGGKILGPYDSLVIDEGHQAPKFFRDAFSLKLAARQPETLSRLLKGSDFDQDDGLQRIYDQIFELLPKRNEEFVLRGSLIPLVERLEVMIGTRYKSFAALGLLSEDEDSFSDAPGFSSVAQTRARLQSAGLIVSKIYKLCRIVLGHTEEEDRERGVEWVKYIERQSKDDNSLVVTPLEVGPLVAPALIGIGSVVVTSATLSTHTGMGYIAREYGLALPQITTSLTLPSPFDYANRSALYVASDTPDPAVRGAEYYDKMARSVHELLAASRGGAFVLCASTDDMNELHDRIYRKYHPMPYELSRQSPSVSPEETIRWFKESNSRVLLGLKTFWEGVDIPGDQLRLVVIPRLPFPNPGDVVSKARQGRYAARLEADGVSQKVSGIRAWEAYSLSEAIMDIKQGGGRLIRTETDRGVVAILDKRAYARTKGYSSKVRNCLPHPELADKQVVLNILAAFARQILD